LTIAILRLIAIDNAGLYGLARDISRDVVPARQVAGRLQIVDPAIPTLRDRYPSHVYAFLPLATNCDAAALPLTLSIFHTPANGPERTST